MITAVYGTVDALDIIFTQSGGEWVCPVPADWKDGQYVCSFIAHTDAGETGYWNGMLYLTDGNMLCPRLEEDLFILWMLPDVEEVLEKDRMGAMMIRREHND